MINVFAALGIATAISFVIIMFVCLSLVINDKKDKPKKRKK